MSYTVVFCNIQQVFPAVVRDIAYMRSKGMLSLDTFYRLMRNYGIRRTLALRIQGCVERKEYTVFDERGNEINVDEIHDKLIVRRYEFECMLKLKYTKRKHHEIHIELTIEGGIEKHEMFPEPTTVDIQDMIKEHLEEAFESYIKDFWHFLVRDLVRIGELDEYSLHVTKFEEEREYYKELDEGLEGEVYYISFLIKREEEATWKHNKTYESDIRSYIEKALSEVAEKILEKEMDFLKREITKLREEQKRVIERTRYEILERRIERIEKIVDAKEIEKDLEDYLSKELITFEEYKRLEDKLKTYSEKAFREIVNRWCSRIMKARTEGEVRQIMKRIQKLR